MTVTFAFVLVNIIICCSIDLAGSMDATEYLRNFGYLAQEQPGQPSSMLSPDSMAAALREVQRIGGIAQTGRLDVATMTLMRQKRCGLGDEEIVRSRRSRRGASPPGLKAQIVWEHKNITYRVVNPARTMREKGAVRRALFAAAAVWNGVSGLALRESGDPRADLQVSFQAGPHGDGYAFDGRDAVLAHAFYPGPAQGGDVHFDDDENWGFRANPATKEINLMIVAAHEIGHSLGLFHSDHPKSIMYPYYRYDENRDVKLHYYDKVMLQSLYGKGEHPAASPDDDPDQNPSPTTTSTTTTTTPRAPTTGESVPPTWLQLPIDPCETEVDAVGVFRQEIFMFRRDRFWRIDQNGALVERPRPIADFWPGLAWPVDACVEVADRALFFVGARVFHFRGHRLERTASLAALGLPAELRGLRLAYEWHYLPGAASIYLWAQHVYWKLDVRSMRVEVDYPRRIHANWRGVADDASAAFSWGKDLYFVRGTELYKFSPLRMAVESGFPKPFHHVFQYCMPKAEALVSSTSRTLSSIIFVLVSLHLFTL